MSETGELRPWWRTSADDGEDPIARLLEEPGATGKTPAEAAATPTGPPEPPARRPVSLVVVALVAGVLAMVLVLVAAFSADRRWSDGRPVPDGDRTDPTAACHQAAPACRSTSPVAGSVGAEPTPGDGGGP